MIATHKRRSMSVPSAVPQLLIRRSFFEAKESAIHRYRTAGGRLGLQAGLQRQTPLWKRSGLIFVLHCRVSKIGLSAQWNVMSSYRSTESMIVLGPLNRIRIVPQNLCRPIYNERCSFRLT